MSQPPQTEDVSSEAAAEQDLRAFLRGQGASDTYIEHQVGHLFHDEAFVERLNYLFRHVDASREHLLVSGAAIGTEVRVGHEFGFIRVTGAEYYQAYIDIMQRRFAGLPGIEAARYDGQAFPFPDESFSCAVSGHVIEHTPSPRTYLHEHMRVLKPGGYLFIEFPTRYHRIELHTGLPSLEWLPQTIRKPSLRFLRSQYSPLAPMTRQRYHEILETLQPVSLPQIRWWLRSRGRIVRFDKPGGGIVRAVIQKNGNLQA